MDGVTTRRPWWPAASAGLVVVATLVTSAVSPPTTAVTAPGSPEAVAQAYARAVLERDPSGAAGFLSPSSPCDEADLESAYVPADGFVTLVGVRIAQARALVDVTVTAGSAALVPAEWSEEHTLTLTREDGHWLLSGTPWPAWDCAKDVR
jgi:hypothetical protein